MTIQEAIMIIQSIPEKIWNQMSETENEAIEIVVKASEKQIPKEPIYTAGGFLAYCPMCEHDFEYGINDWGSAHCSRCGQKLEWSEE